MAGKFIHWPLERLRAAARDDERPHPPLTAFQR